MRIIHWLSLFSLMASAAAQQAPWGGPDIAASSHDRVAAADRKIAVA